MFSIERRRADHDRKSFTCGKREMDDFLVNYGLAEAYGATFVLVADSGSTEILAYVTLVPDPFNPQDESEASVISLERLAVHKNHQRKGIGEQLLVYVIRAVAAVAVEKRWDAMELYALDEDAKGWYLRRGLGFQEEEPGSMILALPVETILAAFEAD